MARKKNRKNKPAIKKALRGVDKDVRKKVLAEFRFAKNVAKQNQNQNNPTQINPFGDQSVTYDKNGNPIVTQNLSGGQQQILNQGEGLTQSGQNISQNYLNNYQQFGPQDFGQYRSQIEDSVFGRLTKNLEQDYANARQAKEQELYNKGIPFSPDPNSRYQQELGRLDQRFDDAKTDARQRAAEVGGTEMSRQFGIERGAHQQNFADAVGTQQFGTGLMVPNFQGYQGSQISPVGPSEIDFAMQQLNQGQQQIDIQRQNAATNASIAQQQVNNQNQSSGPFNNRPLGG